MRNLLRAEEPEARSRDIGREREWEAKLPILFSATHKLTSLKKYEPGEAFGELALLYNAPRAATIVCKTDSQLWSLERGAFNAIIKTAV